MAVNGGQEGYLLYLLRLWQSGSDERVWRASLENPSSGERHAFADLETLFAFLEAQSAEEGWKGEAGRPAEGRPGQHRSGDEETNLGNR